MTNRTRCVTCQRFVPTGERYCLDCVITERPDERDRDEDDGWTYSDPRDERAERRGD